MTDGVTRVFGADGVEADAHRVLEGLRQLPCERLAFSSADMQARAQVAKLMEQAGLSVVIDPAFNVMGSCPGRQSLAPIVLGSHLDTVPDPGRLDGALGVLAAIECARVLRTGPVLGHPLQVFAFSDEEGTATRGSWGARAVSGQLERDETGALGDASSRLALRLRRAAEDLAALGWSIDPVAASRMQKVDPAAYLELHIEQGPVLERMGVSTAAVTSIAGINRYEIVFPGESGHAGTVPMADRTRDAVVRLARLIERYWESVLAFASDAVVNFGRIDVMPGSFNVIPQEARVAVEIRSPRAAVLLDMEQQLERIGQELGAHVECVGRDAPVELDAMIREATLAAAAEIGIDCVELASWAGHDAAVFAAIAHTGMIFVPSAGGASHCSREHTDDADLVAGLRVLLQTVKRLDKVLP